MADTNVLNTVQVLRETLLPMTLKVGNCIDVCLIIGAHLHHDHKLNVQIVHGTVKTPNNQMYHTWLNVDGVEIDPSRDCLNLTESSNKVELLEDSDVLTSHSVKFGTMYYYNMDEEKFIKEHEPLLLEYLSKN